VARAPLPRIAPAAGRAKIPGVDVPPPRVLLERVRALPPAAPLLERLVEQPGVHLVGGAVRDLLMGGAPSELDLVVEGDAAALAARLGGRYRVHDRFGTSTVTVNGFSYDIARARRETYARPGALPDVVPASLAEDLLRRDFTVNAAAITLSGERAGELTAAPSTLEDLDDRILRVLHDQSFIDDPTRLLRLARYGSRLGFAVEPHTRELAGAAVDDRALSTVSGSRIGAELRLLAREPDPIVALRSLHEHGLDAALDPQFVLDDPKLADSALALLPEDGRRDLLAIAVAARHIRPERLSALLDSLAFEAGDRNLILATATRAQSVARALASATQPSEIAAALIGAPPELVALAGALGPAENARAWLERLRHTRLEIDGGDLLAAGVPEGPAVGAGLRAALAAKLDGAASGREQELAEALRAANPNG
jgi:tRNA nucleotidyltransferase (CCA-adding enzyme)